MNFPFYIARRYLFSKKSHHTINIISGISVCGVALATMALICTMSVFNGFQDMVASLFTALWFLQKESACCIMTRSCWTFGRIPE